MDYFDMLLARKLSGGGASSEAMISDEYDSTKTYAKGDYCIYNNTLYKCKTAISTPEEWNASHWDATIVTDELSQLKGVDDDIQEMIGDEYSSSSAYAVGDYCIYNNTLYKCTTAISTAEAWNPSHWTPTSCDTELSELKTDLGNLIKSTILEGTTSSSGAIELTYWLKNKALMSFYVTEVDGVATACNVFRRDQSYLTVMNNTVDAPVANKPLKIKIFYADVEP